MPWLSQLDALLRLIEFAHHLLRAHVAERLAVRHPFNLRVIVAARRAPGGRVVFMVAQGSGSGASRVEVGAQG